MGQGYSLTTPSAGSAGIDVPELSDLSYEKGMGSARFMKSIRARHHDGVVLVKVLVKPYTPMPLDRYKTKINQERKTLADLPNALGYQRIIETETNGYLVRQFLYNSLYDRLSTRPFLEDIEKKWLTFQLLCALRDCHNREVYHGDIKTENTLVTSWNWLYLSDFSSSFKPVTIPDDNPADFSYFFDTSGRRTCYLAPERFLAPGEHYDPDAKLTWAMDVFSAGCVIAELFLEAPIFSLHHLLRYRRGEYDPAISHLSRIPDKELRDMIAHMIQLDPQKRYSAQEYLEFWKGKVFPEYFYSFLHQYMEMITHPSSGQAPMSGASRNVGEADERIDRVFYDFDKIAYFLGHQNNNHTHDMDPISPRLGLGLFPVRVNIPNHEHVISPSNTSSADDGTLIFLTLVVASLRNTARAASKIRACDVLLAFSERLTDEAKLDRVLPYLMTLLNDEADMVVVAAIRTITQLLQLVKVVTPVNSHVFQEYILPRLKASLSRARSDLQTEPQSGLHSGSQREPRPLVRATYASCIGSLATSSGRFLEMAATLKAAGTIVTTDPEVEPGNKANAGFDELFDDARRELVQILESHTKSLIEDTDPYVRRAFLSSVPELCVFFGSSDSNDIILTHLNTYLNDRDWMLKCAFFDAVVGISTFLGSISLEEFILPLMIQALTDPEEFVVQAVLHSLAELGRLGLLSKPKTWELVDVVARFTVHPNLWVREAAAEFLSAATTFLSPADIRCIFVPMIKSYLKPGINPNFSELSLLDALKKPLPRSVFDQALTWAQKTDRGIFWKPLQKLRMSFGTPASFLPSRTVKELNPQSLSKVARNEEDEQWLSRLRNLGLLPEDETKLLALREVIWRLSQRRSREAASEDNRAQFNSVIPLRTLGITPQTVMFDDEPLRQSPADTDTDTVPPRTIADALLDASMSIDDPVAKRRKAAYNRSRLNIQQVDPSMPPGDRRPIDGDIAISPTSLQPGLVGRRDSSRASRKTSSSSTAVPSSPVDSSAAEGSNAKRTIRHQSSAMSLLDRKSSGKSGAETGTTETNAFGEVEGFVPNNTITLARLDAEQEENEGQYRANHSYQGNDPNILKMLDSMYVDNYPHDVAEFGPMVEPITRRKSPRTTNQTPAEQAWKPTGKLVATFAEHHGAINRVIASPDHVFFLTGGDDGCVRVWDTSRLERNMAARSRQTHKHAAGAKVVGMCFIENTHCFVSCGSDGSVHVVKVDAGFQHGLYRYGRLRLLREYHLPRDEFAVWCEHTKTDSVSTLILATNRSRVLAIDLRTMSLLYILENPVHHGTPTCFCIDRKKNWLCLGTSHGVIDLWDLRFKMRLKGWGVPGKSSIYRLGIHPAKGRGKWICVSGGTGHGEVTTWDIERTICREIYRVGGNKEGPKGYDAWDVDEDRPEGMLGRFATNIEPSSPGNLDRGVRAMFAGSSLTEEQRDVRNTFILTGGSDKKLRFWDLSHIESSTVFSGLSPDEAKPSFTASHPTTSTVLVAERLPRQTQQSSGAGGKSKGSGARPPRSTVISLQQQQLLRSHLDSILDIVVLESPYTMTVSVDRSGVVFVFQ